jgi:hypothetical protein
MTTKSTRASFEVDFPLRFDEKDNTKPVRWLGPNLKEVARAAKKLTLTFHLWPTLGEQASIQLRYDRLAGGVEHAVDLQRGIDGTNAVVLTEIENAVWPVDEYPEGRPEAVDAKEKKEQEAKVDAAWKEHDSRAVQALWRMNMLSMRLEVGAAWPVLVVNPPDGWSDIAEKDMRPDLREAVVNAYVKARNAEEEARGK